MKNESIKSDSDYQGEGFWDKVEDISGLIAAGGLSTRRREKAERLREESEPTEAETPGEAIGNTV